MGVFVGDVELTPLTDDAGRLWKVLRPFSYVSGYPDHAQVDVPAGETTDLASTPRWLWVFLPPEGDWTDASVVHDTAYTQQKLPRLRCDQILREAMIDRGTDKFTAAIIYAGVRIGGWAAWQAHARANLLNGKTGG